MAITNQRKDSGKTTTAVNLRGLLCPTEKEGSPGGIDLQTYAAIT